MLLLIKILFLIKKKDVENRVKKLEDQLKNFPDSAEYKKEF